MGPIALPASGSVYLDANSIIYSYERVEPYRTLLAPVWDGAGPATYDMVTSELTVLEVLVKPFKMGNLRLETGFRTLLLNSSNLRLISVSRVILEQAAHLRATTNLKTPDAIHAATGAGRSCALFVTNDPAFRRLPSLTPVILRDLVTP